jgi:KipI family sensor histidine kinase inhibitor
MQRIFSITERIIEIRDSEFSFDQWIHLRKYLEGKLSSFEEIINTEDSVVIIYENGESYDRLKLLHYIKEFDKNAVRVSEESRRVKIPVRYVEKDTDLAVISELLGLTVQKVIDLHSSETYQLVMYGFIPGFAYLKGVNDLLRLPRKKTPSLNTRKGSVAIAENYTGIYPVDIQGGWHVVGFTDFNFMNNQPLVPGDFVEFYPL